MSNESEIETEAISAELPDDDARAASIRAKRQKLGCIALFLGGLQLTWILYNLVVHHMPGFQNHDWRIPAVTGVLLIIFGLKRVKLKP